MCHTDGPIYFKILFGGVGITMVTKFGSLHVTPLSDLMVLAYHCQRNRHHQQRHHQYYHHQQRHHQHRHHQQRHRWLFCYCFHCFGIYRAGQSIHFGVTRLEILPSKWCRQTVIGRDNNLCWIEGISSLTLPCNRCTYDVTGAVLLHAVTHGRGSGHFVCINPFE